MFEHMTKYKVYSYLVGIFCACIIMSNILGVKPLKIGWIMLPCSILVFPILFIVNDILSEIYGFKMTKNIVYLGFILNIVAIIFYMIAIYLPSNSPIASSFASVLVVTPRLFLAGLCSYMAGNLLNSYVLVKLKKKYPNQLFVRCVSSTFLGEATDSLIFITVGFIGTIDFSAILVMICCQIVFKTLYEIVAYPITRKVIVKMRSLDDGELKGLI